MRIIYERSGGIMGLKSSLTIDLDELPPDQAATLRRVLHESDFFSLIDHPPTHSARDGFQYTLTVETKTIKHTIHTTDTTIPEALHPLIEQLSQLTRIQHSSKK